MGAGVDWSEVNQSLIAIAAMVSALAAVVAAVRSFRNAAKLTELHLTLNSRLTEMLRVIAQTNQAIGRADEKRDAEAAQAPAQKVSPPGAA